MCLYVIDSRSDLSELVLTVQQPCLRQDDNENARLCKKKICTKSEK